MKNDSNSLNELYAKYRKPNMTRAERQEMMEKIYRERYRNDPRKPVSQKGQAIANLICGVVIFAMSMLMMLGIKAPDVPSEAVLILAGAAFAVMVFFEVRYKKEPADELSKELMMKATSYSAYAQIIVMWLGGFITMMAANKSDKDYIMVNSDNLMGVTMMLMGVYLMVRNGVYIWLDRTPADEEE